MQAIEVTFPDWIPPGRIIFMIEENVKTNCNFTCSAKFERWEENHGDGENVFLVSSDGGPAAFFYIGMTTAAIMEAMGDIEPYVS